MSYPRNLDLYFDSCGYPGTPLHGQLLGTVDGDFNVDGAVEFECDDGYELEGSSTRRCLSNGKWSGEDTTCKSKRFIINLFHDWKMIPKSY